MFVLDVPGPFSARYKIGKGMADPAKISKTGNASSSGGSLLAQGPSQESGAIQSISFN